MPYYDSVTIHKPGVTDDSEYAWAKLSDDQKANLVEKGAYDDKLLHRRDVCTIPLGKRTNIEHRLLLEKGKPVDCSQINDEVKTKTEAEEKKRNSLGGGAIAGIVIGVLVFVAIVGTAYRLSFLCAH